MKKSWSKPSFALVLVSFLLPFMTVSCAGQPVDETTGASLALGRDLASSAATNGQANPLPTIVGGAALLAIAGLIAASRPSRQAAGMAAACAIIGAADLSLLLLAIYGAAEDLAMSGVTVAPAIGIWLAIFSFVGAAVASLAGESSNHVPKARPSSGVGHLQPGSTAKYRYSGVGHPERTTSTDPAHPAVPHQDS